MKNVRILSNQEKAVIASLLKGKPEAQHLCEALDNLVVSEMIDGGMGSLSLVPNDLDKTSRSFGQQLVLGEFTDSDGIPVSVALNVDRDGNLFELDIWKVDFSPLLKWPEPAAIRIVG